MRRLIFLVVAQVLMVGLVGATEPRLLFHDSFDQRLGDGWTWLRENADAWRIQDGALEIRVEPGKANTVKNALVRTAPDRATTNYAVEVTVTFTADPVEQYEQAGITWYHQAEPILKLVHEHIDGEDWIIPGRQPAANRTVQLRMVVERTKWTAQFRADLDGEFKTAGSGTLPPPGDDQISLQCYDGPANAAHWMRFDDFRIVQLP